MRVKGMDAMHKEFGLEAFFICCSVGAHCSGFSPDVPLREKVARRGRATDVGGRLLRNVIKGSGVEEHGLGVLG
jgi:hypothetical protein